MHVVVFPEAILRLAHDLRDGFALKECVDAQGSGEVVEARVGEDVVGAEVGMKVAAGGDGGVVLAPLVAVGRIDELEVETFVRKLVVGKGAAEHGGKYEGGGMNDEGFVFDFLESVMKLAGGVFERERLEMGEGLKHKDEGGRRKDE